MHDPTMIRGTFKDSEEWSAAIGDWNLHFRQIDRGPLDASVVRVMSPGIVAQRVHLSRRFHQSGFAPRETLTFGVADQFEKISWYGNSAQPNSLMNFNRYSGFDAVSEAGFAANTFSISSDVFEQEAAALGLPILADKIADSAEQFHVKSGDLDRIRTVTCGLLNVAGSEELNDRKLAELQYDLTHLLVRSVANPDALATKSNYSQRQRAVDRALEFINSTTGVISIGQVYEYSGISYRTLNRGFKERFGMGPKQYIVAFRLAGARQALMNSRADTQITDVASDWGFWHLGRFAADYKNMFNELPSETLKNRIQ